MNIEQSRFYNTITSTEKKYGITPREMPAMVRAERGDVVASLVEVAELGFDTMLSSIPAEQGGKDLKSYLEQLDNLAKEPGNEAKAEALQTIKRVFGGLTGDKPTIKLEIQNPSNSRKNMISLIASSDQAQMHTMRVDLEYAIPTDPTPDYPFNKVSFQEGVTALDGRTCTRDTEYYLQLGQVVDGTTLTDPNPQDPTTRIVRDGIKYTFSDGSLTAYRNVFDGTDRRDEDTPDGATKINKQNVATLIEVGSNNIKNPDYPLNHQIQYMPPDLSLRRFLEDTDK